MKSILPILLMVSMLLVGCNPFTSTTALDETTAEPIPKNLTVFAAASLTDAFSEIGQAFEATNIGVKVIFNFAGSQSLRTQIEQGAQADVFASANIKEMDALVAGGFVTENTAQFFLTNELVVILPANNPAEVTELADLSRKGVKIILAAKEVPLGNYTLQMLEKLDATMGVGYKGQVLDNVVSYENTVKQVVTKVQLGEADAGIVYISDSVAAPELLKLEIPSENNIIAQYPLASLSMSKNPELVHDYIAFVLSPEGQAVLQKWGFVPIK